MKENKLLKFIGCLSIVLFTCSLTFSQNEVRAKQRASRHYISTADLMDKAFPDWVVEFEVPSNSRAQVVNADGNTEKSVVSKGLVTTDKRRNNKIIVEIKVGWSARRGYNGTISQFANNLFVQYLIPNQPRGPIQPRGPR